MRPDNDAPGKFTAAGEIRFQRMLPGPIERVWEYLTVPEKRATWLARGSCDARPGGDITLEFHNSKLSAPGDPIPEKYQADCQDGARCTGRVLRCEPPRLLSHTWGEADGSASEVTYELTPQGREVLLVLIHRKLGDQRAVLTSVAGGWHTHLAILVANLEGRPPPSFWSTHTTLEAAYEKRLDQTAAR
jgi:uncharacterized protein YndB with AHSA1/START domain